MGGSRNTAQVTLTCCLALTLYNVAKLVFLVGGLLTLLGGVRVRACTCLTGPAVLGCVRGSCCLESAPPPALSTARLNFLVVVFFFFNTGALGVSAHVHARSHTDNSSGGGNRASTPFLSVGVRDCVCVSVHSSVRKGRPGAGPQERGC